MKKYKLNNKWVTGRGPKWEFAGSFNTEKECWDKINHMRKINYVELTYRITNTETGEIVYEG